MYIPRTINEFVYFASKGRVRKLKTPYIKKIAPKLRQIGLLIAITLMIPPD